MRLAWLFLVLAVVLGACDHSGSTSTETSGASAEDATTITEETAETTEATAVSGTTVDACDLVNADDAAGILGSPAVVDTTPSPSFGETSVCAWVTESDALLVVSLFEGREYFSGGLSGAEPLDVGDEGYIGIEPTFGGVDIQVLAGEWVLSLSAAPFAIVDVEGLPASMTAAAQQAVDRLP